MPERPGSASELPSNPFASTQRSGIRKRTEAPRHIKPALIEALDHISVPQGMHVIGKGSEHLVFEFEDPSKSEMVYKVNFHKAREMLQASTGAQEAFDTELETLTEEMEERKAALKGLQAYFGTSAVPTEKSMIGMVPVTREIVREVFPDFEAERLPDEIPARIMIQRRVDTESDPCVSLTAEQMERRFERIEHPTDEDKALYDDAHRLLTGQPDERPLDQQRKFVLQTFLHLHPVWEKAKNDRAFRDVLRNTVRHMISYVSEVGIPLDLAGGNNAILIERDGEEWKLKLLDVLPINDTKVSDLIEVAHLIEEGKTPTKGDVKDSVDVFHTIRVINALAILVGIPERVRIPEAERVPAEKWRSLFLALFTKARKMTKAA